MVAANAAGTPATGGAPRPAHGWRLWAAGMIDERGPRHALPRAVRSVLVVTIGASVATAMIETLPGLHPAALHAVVLIQALTGLAFAAEYLTRLWTAPDIVGDGAHQPWRARRRYAWSPLGLIDAAVALALLLAPVRAMPRLAVELVAMLALLKLVRFAPGLALLVSVLRAERRSLGAALLAMGVLLLLASTAMYALEHAAQPEAFSSIPKSLWWGIVTIATVGYGDIIPQTMWGRLIGGCVMLLGIAMFAVPAGILATGFAAELRRRDFVVTWEMVAKVPLFATLDAGRIAEIARLLEPRTLPGSSVLVRRGETADAMYFLVDGEVEVDVQPVPVRLGKGQFFGEIGLLHDTVRTATVTTLGECHLLALQASDFRRLMARVPEVRDQLAATARARVAPPAPPPSAVRS